MSFSIYELTEDYMNLLAMAEDPDIDEQAFMDTLEGIEGALEDKADGYAKVMKQLEANADGLDAEIKRLQEINEAGFRFYYNQPPEKRLDFSIEYNFHIRTSEKHAHLIHHKLTPILLSPTDDIWLALCTVSLSPEKNMGDVLISDHTCTDRYIYSFEGRRWHKQPELNLSDREKEILQLSVKGMSNMEIGENLFIDANTVKFHKKKLFEKLHAENITEAVGIAANLRLI